MADKREVVVLSAVRSAVGTFNGALAGMEPAELGGVVAEIDKLFGERFDALVNSLELGKPPRGAGGSGSGHGGGRRPRHLH